ncbi:hypothetical protein GBA52_007334 [Prunus armeniaca]|nr:hypothetical protein GBA52_007334 [Prunus armeniaca]
MAGVGVIIRKIASSCIGGHATQVRAQSPLMAEVLALKHGLLRAKELNLVNVVVESDSQVAINSVQKDVSSSNWELYPILKDIRFLKAYFTNLNWAWVPREANRIKSYYDYLLSIIYFLDRLFVARKERQTSMDCNMLTLVASNHFIALGVW